jgi:hypothetical protein
MGLFGCSHTWKKYGRRHDGIQQYRCRKCGRLKNKQVSQFLCFHQWKRDRRRAEGVVTCKKCGKSRTVTAAGK